MTQQAWTQAATNKEDSVKNNALTREPYISNVYKVRTMVTFKPYIFC
jgi:hypothetical protein